MLPWEVRAIADLASRALRPGDDVRTTLLRDVAATSGLHPSSVERLTDLWAAAWQAEGVARCLHRAGLDGAGWQPIGRVAVVAPGNLCVATWQALLEPLLAGNRVRVRPGSGDPLAATRLRDAIALVDPRLAARIEVDPFVHGDAARWRRFLQDADALAVYGGNAAVWAVLKLAAEVGFAGRLRCHGDLQSCAIVTAPVFADAAAFAEVAPLLAHDALLADGRGCMSLRAIYVLGQHTPDRWQAAHAQLAAAMATVARDLPAGQLSPQQVATARLQADGLAFAAAQGPARRFFTEGADWWLATDALVTAPHPSGQPLGPAARGVVVRGVPDWPEWVAHVQAMAGRLSVVAVAGDVEVEALDALAVPRLCAPGQMQAPPADRAPDGHRPLDGFVRWLDR